MSETATVLQEVKKFDLLLVSSSSVFDQRLEKSAAAFGYSYTKVESADKATEVLDGVPIGFVVLDSVQAQNQNDIVGYLQTIRFVVPDSPILVIFPKKLDKSVLQWIRKSGANFLMSESEILELGRFDFFMSQSIGTEYLPVKHGDFKLGTKIEVPLFYFMSANRKYFPIVTSSSLLDESRLEKIKKIGDVYIKRSDIEAYNRYQENNQDQSAKGLIRRCRVQFNDFREAYLRLVNHLTEEAEGSSYEEGKKLLDECQKLSSDLVTSMMSAGSVFDIISQSVDGDFSCIDRAPERAAIVGFFCVMADIGKPEHGILAALLADLGIVNLSFKFIHHLRTYGPYKFDEEMRKGWEQYPQLSINCAAQKKLQVDNVVKDAILNSHARLDEKGFPVIRAEKISVEAQLVHFVQLLDDQCQVHWGKPRPSYHEEFKKMLKDPMMLGVLSPTVIQALKTVE